MPFLDTNAPCLAAMLGSACILCYIGLLVAIQAAAQQQVALREPLWQGRQVADLE